MQFNFMRLQILFVIFLLTMGCHSDQIKSLTISKDVRAEGKMIPDSVFEGLIKFYNIHTNKLIEECYFKNGIKDSVDIFYNENGTISVKSFFSNGKQNGNTYSFDK